MKYVFFVTTVGSIHDFILPLIEEKKDKGEILIFAGSKEAEMFFKNYTDYKVIRLNVHPNLITKNTKHKLFTNIICSKLEYRKYLKDIEGAEVYFSSYIYAIVIFSYVKKLLKQNNKVFNCGGYPENKFVRFPNDKSFRAWVMRWIAKWFMGVEVEISDRKGMPVWVVDDDFFKDITIIKECKNRDETIEKYMPKMDILKDKKILIMTVDLLEDGGNYADSASYIAAMDELIELLDEKYPDSYVIKPHPREKKLYGKMKDCENIIPEFLPAEFLLHHPWEYNIGIISTTLKRASEQTDAKVISLIDLFKWTDDAIHEKEILRDEIKNSKILIPKDMDELKKIIRKSKTR